jgi:hypothetical protein
MKLSDPPALTALMTPDQPLAEVIDSLYWLIFLMTPYNWQMPRSTLVHWSGNRQTAVSRWVVELALAVWPNVSQGIGDTSIRQWPLPRHVAQEPRVLTVLVRGLGCVHGPASIQDPPSLE